MNLKFEMTKAKSGQEIVPIVEKIAKKVFPEVIQLGTHIKIREVEEPQFLPTDDSVTKLKKTCEQKIIIMNLFLTTLKKDMENPYLNDLTKIVSLVKIVRAAESAIGLEEPKK